VHPLGVSEIPSGIAIWNVDPARSIVQFAVKQLVISTVKGRFSGVEVTLRIDENKPENSSIEARIAAASVDTGNPRRDKHLRSDDFLGAEKYPYIVFRSTLLRRLGGKFAPTGDLTIHGVTREVTLAAQCQREDEDTGSGDHRATFAATTEISRKQFGVCWNLLAEGGGAIIGDTVKVTIQLTAVRQR
jgi:polyisoprenoid-binding protein YceI